MLTHLKKKSNNKRLKINFLSFLTLLLLLYGCAHEKEYAYAEFSKSLAAGLSFYNQYSITYSVNGKEFTRSFLNDTTIPDNTKSIKLYLTVNNPNQIEYVVWAIERNIYKDRFGTQTTMILSSDSEHQVIPIDLPVDIEKDSIMRFHIEVYAQNGGAVLYRSGVVKYRK